MPDRYDIIEETETAAALARVDEWLATQPESLDAILGAAPCRRRNTLPQPDAEGNGYEFASRVGRLLRAVEDG